MEYEGDPIKNERVKKTRGVSFEEILKAKLIGIESHPSKAMQERMIFEWKGYVWVVPFVRSERKIFLKTVYPSRKHTKQYRKGG